MPARANVRSMRSIMNGKKKSGKLNILTFATHERYEENLCKTGHNFYSLRFGKEWDETYAPVPKNYHIIDSIPSWLDIDLVLSHTSDNRLQVAHDLLSGTRAMYGQLTCPILRHCHVLPDVRFNVEEQKSNYQAIPVDHNSFISEFNRDQWGFSPTNSSVIPHGIDTKHWTLLDGPQRKHGCISVVNEFPSRDWCCGFNLWKKISESVRGCKVVGKCTGKHKNFSQPARNKDDLRIKYSSAYFYLNTSLHSPVPTSLMEAMACGLPVVSTKTCMIPEIVEHGVTGFLSNDPEELIGFCNKLMQDPDLALYMGDQARKTIQLRYDTYDFEQRWTNLFYKVIGDFKI